jgi:uncharacterized protein (UPF0332 family)
MDIPEEVEKHIKIAEEELSSAYPLLENGKLRDSISRAYYSMFHAAKALLILKGVNPRKHSGAIRMFGLHFVDSGFIERVYAKYITYAFSLRSKADYDVYYEPNYEEAEHVVESAERFLERIKRALGELKNGQESSGP